MAGSKIDRLEWLCKPLEGSNSSLPKPGPS